MNNDITIYRKRHIPEEIVKLENDIIVKYDGNVIVTKWECIRPREDINNGISAYFINDGYKISKMFDANGKLVYWYCDIMQIHKGENSDELIYEDLLLDVIVYPDKSVRILDADEFAEAMEKDMIDKKSAISALKNMNKLLQIIYDGEFDSLLKDIDDVND